MDRQEKNKEYGPGEISGKTDMNRNSLENKGKEQESPLEKHRLRRWQKVLAMVLALILVLVAGFAGSFFFLRAKGEKNLKTQVPETAESAPEEEREGIFVTYKGKEYKYNENIINFLCLGIDKDVPIEEKRTGDIEGLADAVLLASVDVEDGLVQLLAIPRDTIVPVKVMDSQGRFDRNENVQITMQYAYGRTAKESCELMTDTVSNLLFRLPIQRYCSINFEAVPTLNDAIGGVDVDVLEDIYGEHCTLYAGTTEHLEGYEALDYIRWRDEWVAESSMGRLERQKQYMFNYFNQAKDAVKKDLTLPVKVFQELDANMCTNITVEDITYLVPELLDITLDTENIAMVPGEVVQGEEFEEYHVDDDALKDLVISRYYEEVHPEDDGGTSSGTPDDTEME
ncbi:MAG TPA: LCP family protein [Candidatus Mediterraneibacter excrementigallinarum]|nr:LCP family protein [Candidatus Mediterraneibacter excrementigallinarum]